MTSSQDKENRSSMFRVSTDVMLAQRSAKRFQKVVRQRKAAKLAQKQEEV